MTRYCVRVRVPVSGREIERRFGTALERALFLIGVVAYCVEVLAQWEEREETA